jgi:hypothetical protein
LALVLALAGSVGCAAAIDALDVEQAQTAARVITALVNDPEIGTRPIDVRVSRGIVRLTGRVRSGAEAARAVEIARQVQGVTRVDSSLRIADDPEPDNEGFDDSGRAQASPPRADRPRVVAAEFAELESRPCASAQAGDWVPRSASIGSRRGSTPKTVRPGSQAACACVR